jgi:hypothetical protein
MRALRLLLPALALFCSAPAFADDVLLGTIVSSGASTTNLTTAAPFQLKAKTKVSVQCDAACYVVEGSADSGTALTVSAATGLLLQSGYLFDIALGFAGSATNYQIAIIPVSGTVNAKVFLST